MSDCHGHNGVAFLRFELVVEAISLKSLCCTHDSIVGVSSLPYVPSSLSYVIDRLGGFLFCVFHSDNWIEHLQYAVDVVCVQSFLMLSKRAIRSSFD